MRATLLPVERAELAAAVTEREYLRLLQLPRTRPLEGDLRDRAAGARDWYARFGRPFAAVRRVALGALGPATATLETGDVLSSAALANRLRAGEAHAVVALCASAGREVAEETARLWSADRPDEAFFLDRFAASVTERLVFRSAAILCREAEPAGETLLPHLSPGCGQWDLADQHRLMGLLTREAPANGGPEGWASLGPVSLLPSGALHPQHSVLAAFGVTRRSLATTPDDLCRSCDLDPCAFRRAPFVGPALRALETR
jgi:hypothetical protein